MKTLLLLRHAKSSWKDASLPDHDRPLNTRGKRDAPRIGQLIRDADLLPEVIVSSSARRARRTAEKVANTAGFPDDLIISEDVYHADPGMLVEVLRRLPADCIRAMLVGHNPGLEDLLLSLTGRPEPMPTAALARIDLELTDWRELDVETSGTLVRLWLPRELQHRD